MGVWQQVDVAHITCWRVVELEKALRDLDAKVGGAEGSGNIPDTGEIVTVIAACHCWRVAGKRDVSRLW